MAKKGKKNIKNSNIELFSTKEGINIIKSPMKAEIVSILNENEMNFDKIVEHTGKSKSTISEHLQALTDEGIIGEKPDKEDRRKKIFYIKSRHLGGVSTKKELEETAPDIKFTITDYKNPFEFYRLLFRTIRVALLKEGINIDPLLHDAGINIGETFYKELQAEEIDKFIGNIGEFWENNKLGRIEVKNKEPLILNAYDCFECEDLPQIGRSACAFDSGVLEAIFSQYFGHKVNVEEVKCYAKGDDYCSFVIKEK
ncbi:V4R domain-containing protein [Methanobacterium sp.]|uniref:V4R domain-containing protein n=1 Tax=Methanobacterium sp. TaxID=2164 RepID=UPI003D64D844